MLAEGRPPLLDALALVGAAYLAIFLLAELMRAAGLPASATRRLVHILSGAPALALPALFGSPMPVILLGTIFCGLMMVSRRVGFLRSIHGVGRPTQGAELYPIGVAAAFVLTGGGPAYPVAVAALALGDASAAVVGARFGRMRFVCWGAVRTLEGTLAAAAVTSACAAAVLTLEGVASAPALLISAVLIGATAALAEVSSPNGLDNVSMPLATAAATLAAAETGIALALLLSIAALAAMGATRPQRPHSVALRPAPSRRLRG